LQGCENDINSMVSSSASQLQDSIYELCRHCGELALATATPTHSLRDMYTDDSTATLLDEEEEEERQASRKVGMLFGIYILKKPQQVLIACDLKSFLVELSVYFSLMHSLAQSFSCQAQCLLSLSYSLFLAVSFPLSPYALLSLLLPPVFQSSS
jgi:hypothetical protein